MGLFDIFKEKSSPKIADSSMIPESERKYYQPDEYYTYQPYQGVDGIVSTHKVITFEERKKTCIPSENGLYPAEILLLQYCSYGTYPNPRNGYPGLWWFQYGIRDVGGALRSLEKRKFIKMDPLKGKYSLTELGKSELKENEYVPYMHKHGKKLLFKVWEVNKRLGKNSKANWMQIINKMMEESS